MTARPIPQSPQQNRLNPWVIRIPILFITGAILTAIVLVLFLFAFQLRIAERVIPGVYALGIDLSGLTLDEAETVLAESFSYGDDAVFTFRDGDRFWQMSASDLGVAFNARETAEQAFAIGHSNNIVRDLYSQSSAWVSGNAISPVITYDQNVALNQLNAIAAETDRASLNSTLSIEGTSVVVTEGQIGRALDVETTLSRLNEAIMRFDTGSEIILVINETPALVSSVAAVANEIETALSAPVTLTANDELGNQLGPWSISVEQIASLLTVSRINNGDGTQSYAVDIDMGAFETYLYTLAPGLIAPAIDGRFDYIPETGTLSVLEPARSGRILNVAETLVRLKEGVFTPENRIVPMAFDFALPRYHNQISANELGITELVAESTTYYTGSSQDRRTNIAVGVSRMNGIIIGPGEEFSFNYYLGEISYENEFVDGLVIFGGRTIAGIGGGICQVSTTVFRAAFNAGLAITERNSHGYRVGYYELGGQPPGLDAAIWQPERDFKFQNNTPHHILIEANVYPGDNALQFRFYSTQHWQVEIEDAIIRNQQPAPESRFISNTDLSLGEIVQVDYAAEGAEVTIYRNIYDMQGNLQFEDYAYTYYVPWQAIYEVAPTDSRLNS
ncbi:MAG: VanW family protein [Phototrophicaceae bacterium]